MSDTTSSPEVSEGPKLTKTEVRILAFIEQIYWETGSLPTDEIIANSLPSEVVTIRQTRKSDTFKAALSARGIQADMDDLPVGSRALLPQQVALVNVIVNIHDKKSLREKLKSVGVSHQRYSAWLNQPAFRAYIQKRVEDMFEVSTEISAYQGLANAVHSGDVNAIRFYFEMRGIYNPKLQINVNVEGIIVKVVEIVAKHVTDSHILEAIATEVDQVMARENVSTLGVNKRPAIGV